MDELNYRLLIVGAGNLGRETLSWAMHAATVAGDFSIFGFLDDRSRILDGFGLPVGIVGSVETYDFKEDDRVVVAVSEPRLRKQYVAKLKSRGAKFVSLIHPSVTVGLNNRWGEGCIFCPGVVITTNVTIGDHVIFNCHSGAGHDSKFGSFCTLSGGVDITGHVELDECVFVGSRACVTPHVKIGQHAIIGAGSVVLKAVEPHSTVFGVPAKKVWRAVPATGSGQLNASDSGAVDPASVE